MSAALLAKMTAHGVNISGSGFGGRPEITESDVAGAMAGLSKQSYELLRLKYCADASYYKSVCDGVVWRMLGRSLAGEYDIACNAASLAAMIVVDEVVRGAVCRACNGTGNMLVDTKAKDCATCNGTGKRQMSISMAAKFMAVSRDTYTKRYQHIIRQHVTELECWESEGVAHISRQFRQEKNYCKSRGSKVR